MRRSLEGAIAAPVLQGALIIGVCIALAAVTLLLGGSYYLASVSLIAGAIAAFAFSYESRKPQARDVVALAVMCALAIASRALFAWLPFFKPTAAIVMIAGMALGPQSGFLAGAIAMLASNFMFGQGYWTPWQMLAFGLAGFVFGLAHRHMASRKGRLSRKGIAALAIAGGVFVLCVLGPILDTSSLLMVMSNLTPEGAAAIYLAGLPVNAAHGVATAATLALLANPILGRFARIERKYGLGSARGRL